jgi:hypothetical protein
MAAEGEVVSAQPDHTAAGRAGTTTPVPAVTARVEYVALGVILAAGAWLRFSRLDLLEFQADEAYASLLALEFVRTGELPLAGLMSSVGVTNPPLFIYLLIPMFAISADPMVVSCFIGLLGLAAVAICWHIGRTYYGPVAGLVAAALFAVSPWAVIYSRKIWAQDMVPLVATATMWAVHAVAAGNRPRAIFWVVMLPLCAVQIHFSGLAMAAAVAAILLWLRPRVDWRFAAAGLAAAALLMTPYLWLQHKSGWADFRRATDAVGRGAQWEQLGGLTIDPVTGYRWPSRHYAREALAIMNGGRIEDVLGLGTDRRFDRAGVFARKQEADPRYFRESLSLGDWLLRAQQAALVAALAWLAVIGVGSARKLDRAPFVRVSTDREALTAWIVLMWLVVPLLVFWLAGLWTYLSYYVILYPAHFLALGAAAQRLTMWRPANLPRRAPAALAWGAAGLLAAGNTVFLTDFYRFVARHGGAHGTYGTALGIKREVARYLAAGADKDLLRQCDAQLALSRPLDPDGQSQWIQKLRPLVLIQLNHHGGAELPQLEWPLLVTESHRRGPSAATSAWPAEALVILVDGNRESFLDDQPGNLAQLPHERFGPVRLFFADRPKE